MYVSYCISVFFPVYLVMDKYYLLSYFFIENRGNSHNIYVEDTEGIQTLCHARNNIPFGEGKYVNILDTFVPIVIDNETYV